MSATIHDQIRQLTQAFDGWIEEVSLDEVTGDEMAGRQSAPEQPRSEASNQRSKPVRLTLVAACTLLVLGLGASLSWIRNADKSPATVGTSASTEPSTVKVSVASVSPQPTVTTQKHPIRAALSKGSSGDEVLRLQQRLLALHFDPGGVDGVYGSATEQAVWAYQTLILGVARSEVTGVVTPSMWDKMQNPVQIVPRRPLGGANHVEIYLPEQVMVIFHADHPVLIAHVSTGQLDDAGNPARFCESTPSTDSTSTVEVCGVALTPGGQFTIDRMVEGRELVSLGTMTNPAFFNDEIAIYGADYVPSFPASHGGVRINQTLAATFHSYLAVGDRVLVWDGVHEPEDVKN